MPLVTPFARGHLFIGGSYLRDSYVKVRREYFVASLSSLVIIFEFVALLTWGTICM